MSINWIHPKYQEISLIFISQHLSFIQLYDEIADPRNAHATENHRQKELNTPYLPYFDQMNAKVPIAHNGAMIQKITICVSLDAFHQYTIFIPKLILLAAMHHPR